MEFSVPEIDRNAPVPLYYQLKQILLNLINQEELKPGDLIPTERELGDKYQLSRITVRTAIQELVQEGYLERRQGVGTFVAKPKIRRGIGLLRGFSEDMSVSGRKPGSKLLSFRSEPAVGAVTAALGVAEGQEVWVVERLRTVDGEPLAHSMSYLNLPAGLTLTEAELHQEVSLWALLESKGIILAEVEDTLQAIAASSRQAKLLGIHQGAPLLLVEGITYSLQGTPVEYSHAVNRADRFKYTVRVTDKELNRSMSKQ